MTRWAQMRLWRRERFVRILSAALAALVGFTRGGVDAATRSIPRPIAGITSAVADEQAGPQLGAPVAI